MVEEQVQVVIVTVQGDPLLALDEGETGAELQEERLDLPQQGALQILLAVGIAETEEVEHVGVTEHQVGREPVFFAQSLEVLLDELGGLLRESGALIEHAVDPGPQRPHAPALEAAHLGVEVALKAIRQRNQGDEVGPGQLSYQ